MPRRNPHTLPYAGLDIALDGGADVAGVAPGRYRMRASSPRSDSIRRRPGRDRAHREHGGWLACSVKNQVTSTLRYPS